ncbi:Hypothetical predicted protein [Lynx pardinus]|uniref:Uncharacterized protein n=1 Tax=Lynx pardinus TaxID=191816 RepID=A0A485P503_LYNPA|nr:Hypothetical predicted protein [Lynx pardinus]
MRDVALLHTRFSPHFTGTASAAPTAQRHTNPGRQPPPNKRPPNLPSMKPRSRILGTQSHLHVIPTIRQEIQMIKQRYFFRLQSDNPTNPIDLSRLEIDLKNESLALMSRAIS